LTEVWVYPLGIALGGESINAAELIEQYGPVRDGFLDRTGFTTLYRSTGEQTGLSLAVDAIAQHDNQWWSDAVDGIIYVTSTGDLVAPGNSHLLQSRLGLSAGMLLLDINDACTGFVKSFQLAQSLIGSGTVSTVLLVLSDTYSKLYPPSRLKVSPLFSDGASALLVSGKPLESAPVAVKPMHWRSLSTWFVSDGSHAGDLSISRGVDGLSLGSLEMNGAGVFNFVLKYLETCVKSLAEEAGVTVADVDDWYVHQGSRAVVTAVEKALQVPSGQLFRSGSYGNTVGSSLPFQLFADKDKPRDDKYIGMLAFGVGLTMAGMLVQQLSD
jgi:3-oxoacyl-[acyl-carrier-protein] synthase III